MAGAPTLGDYGFFRAQAVSPVLSLGQPRENAQRIAEAATAAVDAGVALMLTPELSLTGYSCEDLFLTDALLEETRQALAALLAKTAELPLAVVVGLPWPVADGRVFNVALVLSEGRVRGAVPKGALPTTENSTSGAGSTAATTSSSALTIPALVPFPWRRTRALKLSACAGPWKYAKTSGHRYRRGSVMPSRGRC